MNSINAEDLSPPVGDRHVLKAEVELRLEVPHGVGKPCNILLRRGSCELWGMELALNHPYALVGGMKIAIFTWHGCVIDIDCDNIEISYTSEETSANVAFVNTHAQLEAMRDAALSSQADGPRVMIIGPPESGKSSLTKILVSYATKLGRSPLWVDLDPADNAMSVPGTLSVAPMTASAVTIETYATTGLPPGTATPLVLWFGSTSLENADLYKAQVSALAKKIESRLEHDVNVRSSGLIVNTNGSIQDEGFQLLLHTIDVMHISVVLVMGHDRLYSMVNSHIQKQPHLEGTKIIKLPRSGGVVSRDAVFRRQSRSLSIKRYFNGDLIYPQNALPGANLVPQLTPFLAHVSFASVRIFKLSSVSLAASLLPVAGTQATEAVQLTHIPVTEQLQHSVLAVCHPTAAKSFDASGQPQDLYETGVAGFVSVDRVVMDTEMLHLLCPCAGALPSNTLLAGNITWMD